MSKRFWTTLAISVICLLSAGCDQLNNTQQKQAPMQAASEVRLADRRRFEIKDIVNGTFHGTVMLDTFTGKCWIFGSTSAGGKVVSTAFQALTVDPEPVLTDSKDPLGIR
jgi:hypothetical protein